MAVLDPMDTGFMKERVRMKRRRARRRWLVLLALLIGAASTYSYWGPDALEKGEQLWNSATENRQVCESMCESDQRAGELRTRSECEAECRDEWSQLSENGLNLVRKCARDGTGWRACLLTLEIAKEIQGWRGLLKNAQ